MIWIALLSACGGDPCVALPDSCDPLYAPTFDNVYENTLRPTCGFEGTACHGVDGGQGGLVFADVDEAYAALTDDSAGEPPVLQGDPSCSLLMRRVASEDSSQTMPPGDPLSAAEQCAIRMWIEEGAKR